MPSKSKFFRVAVEGATTDGRTIERNWLTGMAATYNRVKYGARIFCEHIRGLVPDGPFNALGDVLALKAEEITDGPLKGKMGLYAQIAPTPALVSMTKAGKKIYTSMEIDHDFADSKLPYCVGLAVTDSPASLGTDVLTFAAQHPDVSPFRARKQRPENSFSESLETVIEFEDEEEPPAETAPALLSQLKGLIEKMTGKAKPVETPPEDAGTFAAVTAAVQAMSSGIEALANDNRAANKRTADALTALEQQFATLRTETATQVQTLSAQLDSTAAPGTPRPAATGGTVALTDC